MQTPYSVQSRVVVYLLSHVRLFVTSWTVAHRASLSLGFSRQEYWSGLAIFFSRAEQSGRCFVLVYWRRELEDANTFVSTLQVIIIIIKEIAMNRY